VKVLDPEAFAARQDTILGLARHLFATKGYSETTMDDIAHAAELQKPTLYHYVPSKQALLQMLVDRECARWNARIADYAAPTLRETLQRIGRTFLNDMDDPARREIFKILYFESHKNPSIMQAWRESPMQNRAGFRSVFERHMEGHWSKTKIEMFITQFMGALIHFATLSRLRGQNFCFEPISDSEYVDALVETFAGGPDGRTA
jgi:AcrR family transcriptional regulator